MTNKWKNEVVPFRKGNKQEQKLEVKLESREPIKVLVRTQSDCME